jgi:hypothetical protein
MKLHTLLVFKNSSSVLAGFPNGHVLSPLSMSAGILARTVSDWTEPEVGLGAAEAI